MDKPQGSWFNTLVSDDATPAGSMMIDLIIELRHQVLPSVLALCLVVAAALLWRRTRRTSTLVQLVGSLLLFAALGFYAIKWQITGSEFEAPASDFARFMRSDSMEFAATCALNIGPTLFAISYLVYALRQKRV